LQWSGWRGCTYEWRDGIPKPDQGEINCLPRPHMGVDSGICLFFGLGQLNECHGYPQMQEFRIPPWCDALLLLLPLDATSWFVTRVHPGFEFSTPTF
jgi:hypothetical protein